MRELVDLQELILEGCTDSFDLECMAMHLPAFTASVDSLSEPAVDAQWAALYWAIFKHRIGDPNKPSAKELFKLVAARASPGTPPVYVEAQLWLAEISLEDGDLEAARAATERALSLALTLRSPIPYYEAKWLTRICSLFTRAGDVARATKLTQASAPLILKAAGVGGFVSEAFLEHVGILGERTGDFKTARFCFENALALVEVQELPEGVRKSYRDWLSTQLAATCVVSQDEACASDALKKNSRATEWAGHMPDPASLSGADLDYAAVSCLLLTIEGLPLPKGWLPLFEGMKPPVGRAESPFSRLQRESLAVGGAALIQLEKREPIAARNIESFILKRLELDELEAQQLPDATTLPSAMDRVYLRFGLDALALLGATDRRVAADLTLRVSQAANRTLRDADGDALALVANADDVFRGRDAHALLRLTARQTTEELDRLKVLVAALLEGREIPGDKRFSVYDLPARRRLADLGERRELLREPILKSASESSISRNVSLKEVQAVLEPAEVLVVVFGYLGNAIHVAVGRDDFLVTVSPVKWEEVRTDIRLLNLALTASHTPSEELDAEYPAAEAVRLYKAFFEPVSGLAAGKQHVIWIPPEHWSGVPLGSLLSALPPRAGRGYDLNQAPFLARQFNVSVSPSVKSFVAGRVRASARHTQRSFFGAGDPVLSGDTTDGVSRSAAAMRGGRNLAADSLGSLPELPDTGAELRETAKGFGASSTVLTRDAASEASVRRRLLSDYELISFATHGLVREDLKGLTESALVLTPQASNRSDNDGLLTASEIADWNLGARLAVLSACNTAQSDSSLLSAEVHGLTNAFALAGVPAALVTLWPVDSHIAHNLVSQAIAALKNSDARPAAALGDSIRAHLRRPERAAFLHPRFWAPFTIFGDGGSPASSAHGNGGWTRTSYRVFEERDDGAAVRAAILPQGDLVVAGVYGEPTNPIGTIERFTPTGASTWKHEFNGWSPLRLASRRGRLAAAGLQVQGDSRILVVRAFDWDGKKFWDAQVDLGGRECFPLEFTADDSGGWSLLLSVAGPNREVVAPRKLISVEFDPSGHFPPPAETFLAEGKGPLGGIATKAERAWLVALQAWGQDRNLAPVWTGYGESDPCSEVPSTLVGEILDSTHAWRDVGAFKGSLHTASITSLPGWFALTGSTMDRCQQLQSASFKLIDPRAGKWKGAEDPQRLATRLIKVVQRPGASDFVGVGTSERIGDPGAREIRSPSREILGRQSPAVVPGDPWQDVVVYDIDEKGHFSPTLWVEAGSSIALEDAALSAEGMLFLTGSVGGKAFVASYRRDVQPGPSFGPHR